MAGFPLHAEARQLALDMVEIAIGVPRGQYPDRHIGERQTLAAEINAWKQQRNASDARAKWMFTTQRAHNKFAGAYPKVAHKA